MFSSKADTNYLREAAAKQRDPILEVHPISSMRLKIKPIQGAALTTDVDETSTVAWLSKNYCEGHQVAVGFPPRSLVLQVLQDGDLFRVMNDIMEERIPKKHKKIRRKKGN